MGAVDANSPPCTAIAQPEPAGSGTSARFDLPPLTRISEGSIRRVGVEVEFMGLGVRSAARALAAEFGGTLTEEDPHAVHIPDTAMKYWRNSPLVFSFVPRCHGLWGSQK